VFALGVYETDFLCEKNLWSAQIPPKPRISENDGIGVRYDKEKEETPL